MSALLSQVRGLSVTEKFDPLDALWPDIEARSPALSDKPSAELDRGMARYERDPAAVIPWDQFRANLFSR